MQAYTWLIPLDEREEYEKMKFRLNNVKIPLFFLPRTELVDSINITDPFVENAKIGYTTIKFNDDNVMHEFYLDDNSDMGNLAIELTDKIINSDLVKEQLYIVPTYYADDLNAVLQLKLGVLGTVQEDYYSAYFTGKTIRQYGYNKSDYWKHNYTPDELNIGDTFTFSENNHHKFSLKEFINGHFRKSNK